MAGNTFGNLFRLTTFGESHGLALGGIIDGCPAGLEIDAEFIQSELKRRKPGQSKITTQRKEDDEVQFLSGIFEGKTTGTPIGFIINNRDHKSKDYNHIKEKFRPSHADYTYAQKYGNRDYRGGGRASARETVCRIVGGSIAKLFLKQKGIHFKAYVSAVGKVKMENNYQDLDFSKEENIVRCPDENVAAQMISHIEEVRKAGDSVGGIVRGLIRGVSSGLGEPVFDKLHADLAKAMLSINAVKGFEYGSGFSGTQMKGSEHNDILVSDSNGIHTQSNHSGGIQGGISNGEDIYFNVAFKPVATIMRDQNSVNEKGETVTVEGKGRHDPCVVPRAVPIVEAMAALVIMDHFLRNITSRI